MRRRDFPLGLIVAAAVPALPDAQAQVGGAPRFPQTTAERVAGVTPSDHSHLPGSVLRYGRNVRPGATDMTDAIQSAIRQAAQPGGASAYVPKGMYYVPSQTLALLSNVTLYGDGASSIIRFGSTVKQDGIQGLNVTGVRVARLALAVSHEQTGTGFCGLVAFRLNSTHCIVEECEFTGVTQSGVLLSESSHCLVSRNSFRNFIYGTGRNDSADIHLMTDAVSTTITAGHAAIVGANTFIAGTPVHFPSESDFSGVSGFVADRTYYVSAVGLSASAFRLAAAPDGDPITPRGKGKATTLLLTPYDCTCNILESNWCFGGNNTGISIETSAVPNNLMRKNVISNNRIGRHTAYGILAYCHQSGDTYNQITGNYVENITGESSAQGRSAGAGIYVVGMSAVTISNNTITNCCIMTRSADLAPGGIGINSPGDGSAITIVGNSIHDMAQGGASAAPVAGIYVAAAPSGTTIFGNSIGQKRRGGLVAGILVASGNSNLTIAGNNINIRPESAPQTRGILLWVADSSGTNITIAGNTVLGCSVRGISLEAENERHGIHTFTVCGNVISGGGPAVVPLYLEGACRGSVTGNRCSAGSAAVALFIDRSQGVRYSGNTLQGGGGRTLTATGDCRGSVFDESNSVNGTISNAARGLNVRQAAAGKPSGWRLQAGDVVYNTTGSSPFAWQWNGDEWLGVSER